MNLRIISWLLFAVTALNLFSCESMKEKSTAAKDTIAPVKGPTKYFSGEPDTAISKNQITSAGIGTIYLGDSTGKISTVFDSIQSITIYEDGGEWPGKKIIMPGGKYIIAAMINTVNVISSLRTNDPSIVGKDGIHCGLAIDSVSNANILIDRSIKAFFIPESGLWFKADKKTEERFFKNKEASLSHLSGGTIEELFIICGDC